MIRLYSGTYRSLPGLASSIALEHLGHELLRIVDELLHCSPLSDCLACARSAGLPRQRPAMCPLRPARAPARSCQALLTPRTSPRRRPLRRRPSRGCARPCRTARPRCAIIPLVASALSRATAAARSSAASRAPPAARPRARRRRGTSASSSVLSPRSVSAALLDALDRGAQRGDHVCAGRLRRCRSSGPPARRNAVPQIGPEVPPIRLVRTIAVFFSRLADVACSSSRVPVGEHDLEPAGERVAEVAVADDRVELAEVLLVVDRRLGDRPHDQLGLAQALCRSYGLLLGLGVGSGRRRGRRA